MPWRQGITLSDSPVTLRETGTVVRGSPQTASPRRPAHRPSPLRRCASRPLSNAAAWSASACRSPRTARASAQESALSIGPHLTLSRTRSPADGVGGPRGSGRFETGGEPAPQQIRRRAGADPSAGRGGACLRGTHHRAAKAASPQASPASRVRCLLVWRAAVMPFRFDAGRPSPRPVDAPPSAVTRRTTSVEMPSR